MNEIEEELKRNKGTPKPEQSRVRIKSSVFLANNTSVKKGTVSYKSSFHSQSSTKHSLAHMNRESKVTYLLIHNSKINKNKQYENINKFKMVNV